MSVNEVMDLPCVPTFWGSQLGESSSVAVDSDEDNGRQSDFSAGHDSEEEQRHEMEESLYCQLYFKTDSVKSVENSEEESNYQVSDLNHSDSLLTQHSLQNKLNVEREEVKDMKKQKSDDCTDVTKITTKKLQKSRMVVGPNETFEEQLFVDKSSENDGRILAESLNSSEVVLVRNESEKSKVSSDSELFVVEDESEREDSAHKRQTEKCKRSRKTREEVIDVSDTSTDSSLFLDISTDDDDGGDDDDDDDDDDIDVNMVKSPAAGDQGEDEQLLQAILRSLPGNCDWKINNADRLGSSCGEKSRYYNSASKFRCKNCNNRGHFTHACPQPKKLIACILCGKRGHLSRRCSQSLCFRCNRPGHTAKECDRRRMWHEDACRRCGIQGHFKNDCPDNWRQYHLTIISSDIVKGAKLENHRKFCYNCAGVGHFGHDCRRRWRDSYVQPSTPFIVKYDRNSEKRSQDKGPILQDENLSAYVTGRESFLVQHIESESQKKEDRQSDRKRSNQTDLQFVGKMPQQSNEMHQDPLEYDRRKGVGKGNSPQCTNFVRKIKDKLFDVRKSAKQSHKKPRKVKDQLQLDYLPLTTDVDGGEANISFKSFQRSPELLSEMKRSLSSSNVGSLSRSIVRHTSMDGLYVGDFPRSNMETWKNQNSIEYYRRKEGSRLSNCLTGRSDGYYSQQLQFTTPTKKLKTSSKGSFSFIKSEWHQTSTPVDNMNGIQQESPEFSTPEACLTGRRRRSRGRRSGELCVSDMQHLEGDEILTAYYGKNQIRNARRKERKKRRQVMMAQDKANLSVKSSVSQSEKKKRRRKRGSADGGGGGEGIKTERGFRIKSSGSTVCFQDNDHL